MVISDAPEDVERYLRSVIFGYHGALRVHGELYAGTMPPVGYFGDLDDEEIVALVNHQRSSWGNAARPVTTADLARVKGGPELPTGWVSLTKTPGYDRESSPDSSTAALRDIVCNR